MDGLSGALAHLAQSLDHGDLGAGAGGVDEEVNDGDFMVNDGLDNVLVVFEVDVQWSGAVLLHGLALLLGSHESIQGAVGR